MFVFRGYSVDILDKEDSLFSDATDMTQVVENATETTYKFFNDMTNIILPKDSLDDRKFSINTDRNILIQHDVYNNVYFFWSWRDL
jgi:sugar-specific transcriptional regulator TrmB